MIVNYFQYDHMDSYHQDDINFCVDAICRIGILSLMARAEGNLVIYVCPNWCNVQLWNICCDDPFLRDLLMFIYHHDSEERIRAFYQSYIKYHKLTENGLLICKIYTEGVISILKGGEKPIDIVKKLMQMLETEQPRKNPNQSPNSDDKDDDIV